MSAGITVVKISGHCLDDERQLRQFAGIVAGSSESLVIVHGGGNEITRLQRQLGIEPRYAQGLRITDGDSLALVEMALCGLVNKRLVRHLLAAGVDALGMSGVDRGLVCARQMRHGELDMGFTGQVEQVRAEVIFDLLRLGVTPVIAPVSAGDGTNYNLNADPVAGALAAAVGARKVIFVSNVAGVMAAGERMARLTREEASALIDSGVISGGMIPKVETALAALAAGAQEVVIGDLEAWASGGGTTFVKNESK